MRRKKRQFMLLPVSLISLFSLLYLVFNFTPSSQFLFLNLEISYIYFLFFLLFVFIYTFFTFVFANKRRGLLMSFFVIIYLALRLNDLTHPFFAVLLLILFGSLELLFTKRK